MFSEKFSDAKDRFDLVDRIICDNDCKICVEIGTFQGLFSEHILTKNKNCILYCIDPYINYGDYNDAASNHVGDQMFNSVKNNLEEKFGNRVIFIRKFSDEAVDLIPDKIDFLYIDGNHKYKHVFKELELYYPKVKKGGYIMGDDSFDDLNDPSRNSDGDVFINWGENSYMDCGVKKAFNDFSFNNNIENKIDLCCQFILNKD
jgi:predicted O-methyltransferase YrrM